MVSDQTAQWTHFCSKDNTVVFFSGDVWLRLLGTVTSHPCPHRQFHKGTKTKTHQSIHPDSNGFQVFTTIPAWSQGTRAPVLVCLASYERSCSSLTRLADAKAKRRVFKTYSLPLVSLKDLWGCLTSWLRITVNIWWWRSILWGRQDFSKLWNIIAISLRSLNLLQSMKICGWGLSSIPSHWYS